MTSPTGVLPYERLGQGPPLMLLHGIGTSRRDWASLLPRLATHFEATAVDLPGQGAAPPLRVRPTVRALTDAVERDLDARGLDRVHLLGNSLGGRIALALAERGRARSVVAVGPSGASVLPERVMQSSGFAVAGVMTRVLRPALPALSQSAVGRSALLANLRLHPSLATEPEALALQDGFGSPHLWRLLLWSMLLDVPGPMPSIDCPVTLVQGTHDWIAAGQTARFLWLVPGARFVPLPFAGHAPMTDAPDQLVRLVCETAARWPEKEANELRAA